MPNLLNNPLASCFLINLDFLLPHIAHFDNIISLPLLVLETCGFMFLYISYTLSNRISFYSYVLFIKYFKIVSSFFLKSLGEKRFI